MTKTGLTFLLALFIANLFAQNKQETELIIRNVADNIVRHNYYQLVNQTTQETYTSAKDMKPSPDVIIRSPYNDWRYWNGVLNIAMSELGEVLNEDSYKEYASKNFKFMFNNYQYFENQYKGEDKWVYPFAQLFKMDWLDDCGAMGAALIDVYIKVKNKTYKEYIDKAANHITNKQERLDDRTLVRPTPHEMTLWADDLYMSIPFLARMGELTGDVKYFDDAAKQVINSTIYLFDSNTGLYYHCWYSDEKLNGVARWGRANGWVMVAQVELLSRIPENHPQRDTLLTILKQQIVGVSRHQDVSGLWHQLLDKQDSYLESSCTAMFTYSIAKAVNQGWIHKRYYSIAQQGWKGLCGKITADGQVQDICVGTGINDNTAFYYNRPTKLNDIHGLGAILLAGIEILKHSE